MLDDLKTVLTSRCLHHYDVRGEGILDHDVLQLHCQQILALVVIMHSCG